MADKPLIQDFSANTFENPEKKAEIAEQNKEDELLRSKAKGNTESMNNSFMDGFNMTKFNETDMDTVNLALKLEAEDRKNESLDIGFDDIGDALNTDEIDIASISYETKDKTIDDGNIEEINIGDKVDNGDMESQEKLLSIDEKLEVIQSNIYVPTIELLFENELITIDEHILLINHIYENNGSDDSLDLSKIIGLENVSVIEEYFNKIDNADKLGKDNKNYEDFIQDFPDYKNDSNNNDGLENAIFSIIGRNYIKVEGSTLPADTSKEKSLLNAIKTSANKIDFYSKNTPKDSQTYKNAIKNIHSGNIEKALEGFDSLYLLVFSNEGISGAGMEKGKKALKKSIDNRLSKIQEKREMIELQIKSGDLSDREKNENIEELHNLQEEEKEVEEGDIFTSGKQDIYNEGNIGEGNDKK